jgi:hypothetical protein
MAEKSIEEKSRKIASQRPEAGKEFQQMQAAQNQLLEIQAAQKQNLMEQRVMSNSQAEQNQILAQAANVGAQSVAGNMQLNQATQQTMGRYGLSQPRTSSQIKQRQSEVVTKQNVTIHNNTTNITNNTVPANIGGPIQGRPVQFQQPAAQADGGMGKFKNWLNQTFARQEEAAKKRDREYQRRETALTKSSNKMMRKIEEFSKDITKKLDPRNVGRTIGGQLKTILRLVGLGVIAKNFTSILDWLFGAQKKVENEYIPNIKNFFAWIRGDENAHEPGLVTKITGAFENTFGKLLFGKDYERDKDKGLLRGIRDYLWKDVTGSERGVLNILFDKIKDGLKQRSEMAKNAIVLDKSDSVWDIISHPGEAFKEFLSNLTNYFSVLIGGEAAMRRIQGSVVSRASAEGTRASEKEEDKFYNKQEKVILKETGDKINVTKGDVALLDRSHNLGRGKEYKVSQRYMGSNGIYNDNMVGATMAASLNAKYGAYQAAYNSNVQTASVGNDFAYLYHAAQNGPILVSKSMFEEARKYSQTRDTSMNNIRRPKDSEYVLIRVPRPEKEIKKDLEDIPGYKTYFKFRKVEKGPDGELRIVQEPTKLKDNGSGELRDAYVFTNVITLGLPAIDEAALVMPKIKKVPLYAEQIVRTEEVKDQRDIIRYLTQEELEAAGYVVASNEDAIRAAAYGYVLANKDAKIKMDELSFNEGDVDNFLLPLQQGLDAMDKAKSFRSGEREHKYDVNANYLTKGEVHESVYDDIGSQGHEEPGSGVLKPEYQQDGFEEEEENADISTEEEENADGAGVITANGATFNVGNAINHLVSHAHPDSVHRCAEYVRKAMQAGGLNLNDRPGYAGAYADYLPKKGWKKIPLNSKPEPGDTVVVRPFVDKNGKSHPYGHIAMYAGEKGKRGGKKSGWVSDFFQGTREGYSSRPLESLVSLWRYGGGPIETDPSYSYSGSGQAYTGEIDSWVDDTKDRAENFSDFLSKAGDTVRSAIHSLSHEVTEDAGWVMDKAGDGVDWEASLHGGTSYYPGPYQKSKAEKYMYARYTGKDTTGYAVPSSISGGSTLKRDEWWAKFFDEDGNLKISKEDNVNPALLGKLEKIEIELKKGNEMSELDLKMAAHGLDAEMSHNAAETRDQQRLISALMVRNPDKSMPMTGGE